MSYHTMGAHELHRGPGKIFKLLLYLDSKGSKIAAATPFGPVRCDKEGTPAEYGDPGIAASPCG